MKTKQVEGIGVDAGLIIVADASFAKKKDFNKDNIVSIPNGRYKIKIIVYDTWRGTVNTQGELKITTGKMIITDPCYIIEDEKWLEFLNMIFKDRTTLREKNYEYLRSEGIVIADNMGGDGVYKVGIKLDKMLR